MVPNSCLPSALHELETGLCFRASGSHVNHVLAVGYMLDVYHGRIKAEKSITDYVLFVSFFPQVASGPISKAEELLPQISKHPIPF